MTWYLVKYKDKFTFNSPGEGNVSPFYSYCGLCIREIPFPWQPPRHTQFPANAWPEMFESFVTLEKPMDGEWPVYIWEKYFNARQS
jgi:hypothetical protein